MTAIDNMIDDIVNAHSMGRVDLTEWELEFIEHAENQRRLGNVLSDRAAEKVHEIFQKVGQR